MGYKYRHHVIQKAEDFKELITKAKIEYTEYLKEYYESGAAMVLNPVQLSKVKTIDDRVDKHIEPLQRIQPFIAEVLHYYPDMAVVTTGSRWDGEDEFINEGYYSYNPKATVVHGDDVYTKLAGIEVVKKYRNHVSTDVYEFTHEDIPTKGNKKGSAKLKAVMKAVSRYLNNRYSDYVKVKVNDPFLGRPYEVYKPSRSEIIRILDGVNGEKAKMEAKISQTFVGTSISKIEIESMLRQGYQPETLGVKEAIQNYIDNIDELTEVNKWFPEISSVYKNEITGKYTVISYDYTKNGVFVSSLENTLPQIREVQKDINEEDVPSHILGKMAVIDIASPNDKFLTQSSWFKYSRPIYYPHAGIKVAPNRWWVLTDE